MSHKPGLADSYQKEFIVAMQAKGKLPRTVTEASERYDEVYYETTNRVFPGPGGKYAALESMIKDSTKRIDKVAAEGRGGNAMGVPENTEMAHDLAMMEKPHKRSERDVLKKKLQDVEKALHNEKAATTHMKTRILEARAKTPQ